MGSWMDITTTVNGTKIEHFADLDDMIKIVITKAKFEIIELLSCDFQCRQLRSSSSRPCQCLTQFDLFQSFIEENWIQCSKQWQLSLFPKTMIEALTKAILNIRLFFCFFFVLLFEYVDFHVLLSHRFFGVHSFIITLAPRCDETKKTS